MSCVVFLIDLFTDTAAILNSAVSNNYYGMLREADLYVFAPWASHNSHLKQ